MRVIPFLCITPIVSGNALLSAWGASVTFAEMRVNLSAMVP